MAKAAAVKAPDANAAFGIPPDVAERLRAQAVAQAAANIDESAILAQMIAEETEKLQNTVRLQARSMVTDDLAPVSREGTGTPDSQGFPRKYYAITISTGSQQHDLQYAPVGVNGYAWKIMRGVRVIVPSVVVETLDHAVEDVPVVTQNQLICRPAHRFPYSVHGEVSEAEYLAFMAGARAAAKASIERV